MPEAAATTPSAPGADESAVPAPAAAEPAEGTTTPEIGSMADAFRVAGPEALKGRSGRQRQSDEPDPAEASAPADGASKSAEPPSRRGAAARISEQQAEIDRLVSEREAERQRAAAHEAEVQKLTAAQEAARRTVLEKIGDDQEFERLQNARLRREALSWEEDEKLDTMIQWREHASSLWEMTDRALKVARAQAIASRVEQYGLDRKTAFEADQGALLDHVAETVEARVRAEMASEVAELKAQLKGLRTQAKAATRAPVVGGSSDPGALTPADTSSPTDWFRTGLRAGAQRRPGASARRSA